MNEPGVSGALGVPFRFRELESAFGGCITLGSIEIWDSTFFFCGFCRYRSLFPSLLPDSFLMARVMWLLLDNLLLCWFVVLVVVFSLLHGNSGALSFTFLFPPREDCISGHCKLVFLLWSGHGDASTARLKFCLTILRFSSTPSYPCAIPTLLVLRVVYYSSSLIHLWSYQTLDQSFQGRVSPFVGFLGLGLSFQPCLFDRDSPFTSKLLY
jgi:hypothetical protein